MSELFLIRHGQASFGSRNYDRLSELGQMQSRILGDYFRDQAIQFDLMMCGSMERHEKTLDGIVAGLKNGSNTACMHHEGLNEYSFEAIMPLYQDLHADDELVKKLKTSPADRKLYYSLLRRVLTAWSKDELPGTQESWQAFKRRVLAFQRQLLEIDKSGQRVLVVSSGGAISYFTGLVLGLDAETVFDLNMQIKNTGISHFYFNRQGFKLAMFNALPHLAQADYSHFITYA